ncbi:MAG: nucleotidyl transferase AbiEii/AbiGii toxin family protein [Nanoarchaeota archaeon]|nr:nucleotidyl transferase AbiEii/AbiGii toxin family protein [Nanoarchaeota archaeon]
MITKEMLLEIAKKKGLTNREHMEKDYFQDLFLFHLYKKTNLLIFKGGTCLYKIYGLPRFSEDLDFSVLGETDTEKLVNEVADKIGAEVKNAKRTKNSLLIRLGFKGILTSYNSLRIDISLKNEVFGYDVKNYVPPYIDLNPFSLKVLNLKEMLAEKIHSILARDSARDLYDLFFLTRFVEPDKEIIEKKLGLFGMKFDYKEFQKRINGLKSVWEAELKPFVLAELPGFEVAKDFVLEKISRIKKV